MIHSKKKKKFAKPQPLIQNLAFDCFQEVTNFFSSPKEAFSFLLTCKLFKSILQSPSFFGCKWIKFTFRSNIKKEDIFTLTSRKEEIRFVFSLRFWKSVTFLDFEVFECISALFVNLKNLFFHNPLFLQFRGNGRKFILSKMQKNIRDNIKLISTYCNEDEFSPFNTTNDLEIGKAFRNIEVLSLPFQPINLQSFKGKDFQNLKLLGISIAGKMKSEIQSLLKELAKIQTLRDLKIFGIGNFDVEWNQLTQIHSLTIKGANGILEQCLIRKECFKGMNLRSLALSNVELEKDAFLGVPNTLKMITLGVSCATENYIFGWKKNFELIIGFGKNTLENVFSGGVEELKLDFVLSKMFTSKETLIEVKKKYKNAKTKVYISPCLVIQEKCQGINLYFLKAVPDSIKQRIEM